VSRGPGLSLDTEVARLSARMFVTPSLKNFVLPDPKSNQPKSEVDLMVAATAIVHGATLVTMNRDVNLRIHAEFPLPSLYEPFAMEWLVGGS
jgi:predicted nucleic acid-binding protein